VVGRGWIVMFKVGLNLKSLLIWVRSLLVRPRDYVYTLTLYIRSP
jgi:hypothetical protein